MFDAVLVVYFFFETFFWGKINGFCVDYESIEATSRNKNGKMIGFGDFAFRLWGKLMKMGSLKGLRT